MSIAGNRRSAIGRARHELITPALILDLEIVRRNIAAMADWTKTHAKIRLSTIYPPAWITWMAEHEPSYARGMTRWLNVGDYIAYRLCGEMALDYSMGY